MILIIPRVIVCALFDCRGVGLAVGIGVGPAVGGEVGDGCGVSNTVGNGLGSMQFCKISQGLILPQPLMAQANNPKTINPNAITKISWKILDFLFALILL